MAEMGEEASDVAAETISPVAEPDHPDEDDQTQTQHDHFGNNPSRSSILVIALGAFIETRRAEEALRNQSAPHLTLTELESPLLLQMAFQRRLDHKGYAALRDCTVSWERSILPYHMEFKYFYSGLRAKRIIQASVTELNDEPVSL